VELKVLLGLGSDWSGLRASLLTSALGNVSRLQDGVRGVPTNVVRPLVLGRLSRQGPSSNRVAGAGRRSSTVGRAATARVRAQAAGWVGGGPG
jgi:hypothetical protein